MKHQNVKKPMALLLALALTLCLAACGASSSGGTARSAGTVQQSFSAEEGTDAAAETTDAGDAEEEATDSGSVYQKDGVKLIRRASLSVEATDLDAACASLEALTEQLGGYLEDSSLYQGSYDAEYRSASYTVRVPSEQYSAFLAGVEGDEHCHLVSRDESTEDVGQAYADTETHITALKTKLKRLNELLAQAQDMEDIITIESAITEAEQELASYSSDLNRYDDLIDYATISVDIEQVEALTEATPEQFPARLAAAFLEGCGRFWDSAQDFAVWVAGNIWSILLVLLLAVLIVRLRRRWRVRRRSAGGDKKSGRQTPPSGGSSGHSGRSGYQPVYQPERREEAEERAEERSEPEK